LYARVVRLRIAAVIVVLVVLPGIAFAVAENHQAAAHDYGWTAYAQGGVGVPPGATPAALRAWAANYQKKHPDATCTVTATDASCNEYDPVTGASSGAGIGAPLPPSASP
jgi:hypothetical protein